jgi:hypothetical protein
VLAPYSRLLEPRLSHGDWAISSSSFILKCWPTVINAHSAWSL